MHNVVIQAVPSFSGTGQTEVGWSVTAAGSPIIMTLTSHMIVSFPLPNGSGGRGHSWRRIRAVLWACT